MNIDMGALHAIEVDRGISVDELLDTIKSALLTAYRHTAGHQAEAAIDIDAKTGEVVEKEQKGRGYEVAKGEYVPIEKDELEAVQIESNHTIDIDNFKVIDNTCVFGNIYVRSNVFRNVNSRKVLRFVLNVFAQHIFSIKNLCFFCHKVNLQPKSLQFFHKHVEAFWYLWSNNFSAFNDCLVSL